jgi:hypothetical protein
MIIADLVRALNDLLDLQANLCGLGEASTVNVKDVVQGRAVRPVEEVIPDDIQPELEAS